MLRNALRAAARSAAVDRKAGARHAFKTAVEIQKQIEVAMRIEDPYQRKLALAAIPGYRSRGHGGKHRVRHQLNF